MAPPSLAQHLKPLVERAAVALVTRGRASRRVRRRVLVLAYHNVVPDDAPLAGDRALHLSLSAFRSQMELLRAEARVIHLDQALTTAPVDELPRVVITFDDGYRGAVELATAVLAGLGLAATIFVPPGRLGEHFWWDLWAPVTGNWDPEVRHQLLTELAGSGSAIADWARRHGATPNDPGEWARMATEAQLAACLRSAPVKLAPHSWSHPNLAAVPAAALVEELTRPLIWLRDRFEHVVPWLAYPYGLASPTTAAAARQAGYDAALLVSGGWWPLQITNPFELPRWNVPAGISLAGFRLRLSGWLCR